METQPTQQGLMQLFMSLGLSTADSLATLGEGGKPEASGFDSLLAGYLPDPALASDGVTLQSESDSLLNSQLSISDNALDTIDLAIGGITEEVESLPLFPLATGEVLPSPKSPITKIMSDKNSLMPSDESSLGADDKVQSLLENQGFYAQSLVSSTLQKNMTGKDVGSQTTAAGQTRMAAISEQSSAAHALASFQARGAVSNKALTDTVESPIVSEANELAVDDDLSLDRFLGATVKDSRSSSSSLNASRSSVSTSTSPLTAAGQVPVQLTAMAESNVSLALSMGEDPIQQSLQDLTAVEEGEKTEVEAKLLSTERKQDDQTLKLTKGQQAWGDALSERISMNAAKNIKQVTIHLDPPELGSLELKLQIKDDQQTQVQVQVQNPQVKEALESSAHRLREMLESEGLELAEFDVQTHSDQSAGSEQHNSEQELTEEQQNSDTSLLEGEDTLDINLPKNNNLLDTFV